LGTRLLSEYLIKKHNPQIRYVRMHTSGKNQATLYAWNDQLELPDKELAALKQFAAGYLPPSVCYHIKEYSMVQVDKIPQVYELPDRIVQTAMKRNLDQYGVIEVMNSMLTNGEMVFDRFDYGTGTLHFHVRMTTTITEIEKELIRRYLYEIIPLGSKYEIIF
jgi:hypothetical protein